MTQKNIEQIRMAAYYIWEKEGRPEGKDEEIWYKACAQIEGKTVAVKKQTQKAVAKKQEAKIIVKPVNKPVVKKTDKPVAKVTAKPVAKVAVKPAAKSMEKKSAAKPAMKAKSTEASAKIKYNPIPVKTTSTKIITPLYGSIKK